jgi:hypothetical protein
MKENRLNRGWQAVFSGLPQSRGIVVARQPALHQPRRQGLRGDQRVVRLGQLAELGETGRQDDVVHREARPHRQRAAGVRDASLQPAGDIVGQREGPVALGHQFVAGAEPQRQRAVAEGVVGQFVVGLLPRQSAQGHDGVRLQVMGQAQAGQRLVMAHLAHGDVAEHGVRRDAARFQIAQPLRDLPGGLVVGLGLRLETAEFGAQAIAPSDAALRLTPSAVAVGGGLRESTGCGFPALPIRRERER